MDQTWKAFNTKFKSQTKDQKSLCRVRQILGLFCISLALILGWNCVKGLRLTKNVKQIKFEGVWGRLESKNCCRQNHSQNTWDKLHFLSKTEHYRKSSIYFFQRFLANTDKKIHFGRETVCWHSLQNFLFCFMSLLTALSIKNSHILAAIYFIFLKKFRRPNLKSFQYQICTSVKKSEK